jgi:hypothetical protein
MNEIGDKRKEKERNLQKICAGATIHRTRTSSIQFNDSWSCATGHDDKARKGLIHVDLGGGYGALAFANDRGVDVLQRRSGFEEFGAFERRFVSTFVDEISEGGFRCEGNVTLGKMWFMLHPECETEKRTLAIPWINAIVPQAP